MTRSIDELATKPASSGTGDPRSRGVLRRAEEVVANPLVAYGAILVLQLRVIWNVWRYKDVTSGDTSYYFLEALKWAHGQHDDIVLAPLYTDFFGTVLALVRDAATAVMVHRIAIVLAAALLVLALMRSLLGPAMGLLVAVWWVLLPPNFNVEYEVHLFGLLPVLLAALVVARAPGRKALGVALAIMIVAALTARNELIVAAAIVAVAAGISEVRERRAHQVPSSAYVRAYGVPLLVACLLAGGMYWRSSDQGHQALAEFRAKHDLNMCQVYAFNYQQRHPGKFLGNPFTDCSPLMQQVFGRPMPSFFQQVTANPRAMVDFAGWNARLLLSGVQVALFGATVTGDNPDYFPVHNHQLYALVLSFVVLWVVMAGLAVISHEREFWRRVLAPRTWAGIVLAAVAITTLVVALTQRPRPEYMYGLTVGLLALIGFCVSALLRHLRATAFVAPLACGVTVALCVALPSYYHRGPQPLRDALDRLQVIRRGLQEPGSVLVTSGYNFEICAFLAETFDRHCTSPSWPMLRAQVSSGRPIRDVLDQAGATAIYADPLLQADPAMVRLLGSAAGSSEWRQIAAGVGTDGRWSVLLYADGSGSKRSAPLGPNRAPSALRRLPADLGNPDLVYSGIYQDGWLEKDANVVLAGGVAASLAIHAQVLPLAKPAQRQHLQVLVNGQTVASRSVAPGPLDLEVPIPASRSDRHIELLWANTAPIGPNDRRQATALLKFIGLP
jgi:hypothetical protein